MTSPTTPKQLTNKTKGSLVKVVVMEDSGEWVTPAKASIFQIDRDAGQPQLPFEIKTSQPPPYRWSWSITWNAKVSGLRESDKRGKTLKTFNETGSFETTEKMASIPLGKAIGGRLRVQVSAGAETFIRTAEIRGNNPDPSAVRSFLATLPDCDGFDKILEQESHFKHFIAADGQPVVAFDNGYGLTQMTNPAPTYEQVWSWKENLRAGAALYQSKQRLARAYLSQQGRTYTAEQLRLETWSRWNGGAYHVWDANVKTWVRNDRLLCDSTTGNIGWDMTKQSNQGRAEAELHARDKDSYRNPAQDKTAVNQWRYTGVCYADHLNTH